MNSISALFDEFSYRPRKSAGQNFLVDAGIINRIDSVIECPPEDTLLEVGGGYGVLTDRLRQKTRNLVVVEVDHKLFAMLERRLALSDPPVRLVKGDIMKFDLESARPASPGKITVAGNIPYYLTTPLITRILTQANTYVRRVYLMVQKEVADRLTAGPGTKAYGALSLCAQYYGPAVKRLDVPAGCFKPRPKVDSAFVELTIREKPLLEAAQEKLFFQLIRSIFQSRRKVLSNSLKALGRPAGEVARALEAVGVKPGIRGEELALDKLMEMAAALDEVSA
ncbi:MAG: 16S rRNA (adenine(1518)-N(6)/adenine(1519)-N(6))-dimethyltransferase RsmA [bacterium]